MINSIDDITRKKSVTRLLCYKFSTLYYVIRVTDMNHETKQITRHKNYITSVEL